MIGMVQTKIKPLHRIKRITPVRIIHSLLSSETHQFNCLVGLKAKF